MIDFYEGTSDETAYTLKRAMEYVQLAIKNGDAAYQEKPNEVKIIIKKPKKEEK